MSYSSIPETKKHIQEVETNILKFIAKLLKQSESHDSSKLESPELEIFDIYTPKLIDVTYNSEEYKTYMKEMKVAIDHHYAVNRHHPEHFLNGMDNMNLIDIVEMYCDWLAAVKRHNNGDIYRSIEVNQSRFKYPDMLKNIFSNTAKMFQE